MAKIRGGGPPNLEALDDQRLRTDIESAVTSKTNLTDDEIVSLLRDALPQPYSRCDRALLTEHVVKITPLRCRRGDAIEDPAPVTKKRRIMDEFQDFSPLGTETEKEGGGGEGEGEEEEEEEEEEGEGEGEGKEDPAPVTEKRRPVPVSWLREMEKDYLLEEEEDDSSDSEETEVDDEFGDGRSAWRNVSRSNLPRFADLKLADSMIQELIREVIRPLRVLKLLRHLGIKPAPRILLHGPPGCGKTTLARAIAKEARVPFYEISAAALVSGVSGAAEQNIQKLFSAAYKRAPSIVLIDEIDAMTSKTESSQKEVVSRIVNQLISCIEEPYSFIKRVNDDDSRPGYVLVIAATSRPDVVDPALRRHFDREFVIAAPNEEARLDILSALTCNLKVEVGFDLAKIARCTLGFVGGDLVALVKKAGTVAVNRIMDGRMNKSYKPQTVGVQLKDRYTFSDERMKKLSITIEDFVEAGKMVQPSSSIECFSATSNAKWDDVGGLKRVKSKFEYYIVNRIKFPEVYKVLGVNMPTTFLVYGPNGCGKTLIVKALANEAGAKLIHIKGPELLKEYGDQVEWVMRVIFNYARTCSRCILLLDEVDAIISCFGDEALCVFKQFLIDWTDEPRSDVYVISTTNRPENSHASFIRSYGNDNFDVHLYGMRLHVPFPSPKERGEILKTLSRNMPIDANVDLMALVKDLPYNFTGADLSALMKEAARAAINEHRVSSRGCSLPVPWTIKDAHLKRALQIISPSGCHSKYKNCVLFC